MSGSLLNMNGSPLKAMPKGLEFSDPKSRTLISGPNTEFLRQIDKAFRPFVHARYCIYNAQMEGSVFDRIIVFVPPRMPNAQIDAEFRSWIYYLQTRLESSPAGEIVLL